jgi:hypothetical protein
MPINFFVSILTAIIAAILSSVFFYYLYSKNNLLSKRLRLLLLEISKVIIGYLQKGNMRYLRIFILLLLINSNIRSNSNTSKLPRIANSLPEEQKKFLCDLRRRWRSRGDSSEKVIIETYYFLFRHWWGNSWSEIGKYVRRILPTRWI